MGLATSCCMATPYFAQRSGFAPRRRVAQLSSGALTTGVAWRLAVLVLLDLVTVVGVAPGMLGALVSCLGLLVQGLARDDAVPLQAGREAAGSRRGRMTGDRPRAARRTRALVGRGPSPVPPDRMSRREPFPHRRGRGWDEHLPGGSRVPAECTPNPLNGRGPEPLRFRAPAVRPRPAMPEHRPCASTPAGSVTMTLVMSTQSLASPLGSQDHGLTPGPVQAPASWVPVVVDGPVPPDPAWCRVVSRPEIVRLTSVSPAGLVGSSSARRQRRRGAPDRRRVAAADSRPADQDRPRRDGGAAVGRQEEGKTPCPHLRAPVVRKRST